jgi:acetyl-CoA acetyltransferase
VTDVAVIGFAQAPNERHSESTTSGVEMLVPIFHEVFEATGLTKDDIGFWCSGSSDYLAGRAFSFVSAVDAIGAFPPVMESHVEMDGAWALYEAWLKILTGEAEIALAYGFGKSSAGQLRRVLALQLDPYLVAPLWPDSVSIAALQARLGIEAGLWTEADMAQVAARSRSAATAASRARTEHPHAHPDAVAALADAVAALLDQPYLADPLRAHDCAPVTDGAAVVILAAGHRARELCDRPAWITGFEHRIDSAMIGSRDLTTAPSAATAGLAAVRTGLARDGLDRDGRARAVQIAELHAPFTHQEIILGRALGLNPDVTINPSGGALAGNPMFAAGLARIGHAATDIISGRADVTLGHATSGPALQQNLVAVMESRDDGRAG